MKQKCNRQLSEEKFVICGRLPVSASVQSAVRYDPNELWDFHDILTTL